VGRSPARPAMPDSAYIGTTSGVHRLRDGETAPLGLEGERIMAVHAAGDVLLAGSYGNGLYRSTDGGGSWVRVETGLTASAFRCLGPDPLRSDELLAGTEPARIFRSADGGETWEELEGVGRLPGHAEWFLPYSPRAGAVRNVYADDGRLFASLEVGGLLRSDDGGESWVCEPVIADEDIHHVTGDPSSPGVLYVSLGTASLPSSSPAEPLGGVARSRDGGRSWEKVQTDYTRATLVPPARPDLLVAGPALRVGRGGRIVISHDGGDTWEAAGDGIDVPMPDMVELFVAGPDGDVYAICSGGRLLRATPGEWSWSEVIGDLTVKAVAFE
jgi:photosystem II stability/assembly factor-like uncharacterized protein